MSPFSYAYSIIIHLNGKQEEVPAGRGVASLFFLALKAPEFMDARLKGDQKTEFKALVSEFSVLNALITEASGEEKKERKADLRDFFEEKAEALETCLTPMRNFVSISYARNDISDLKARWVSSLDIFMNPKQDEAAIPFVHADIVRPLGAYEIPVVCHFERYSVELCYRKRPPSELLPERTSNMLTKDGVFLYDPKATAN